MEGAGLWSCFTERWIGGFEGVERLIGSRDDAALAQLQR